MLAFNQMEAKTMEATMDFWGYSDKQVIDAAEQHFGKNVTKLYGKTTGLWRTVRLAGEEFSVNVYQWMMESN